MVITYIIINNLLLLSGHPCCVHVPIHDNRPREEMPFRKTNALMILIWSKDCACKAGNNEKLGRRREREKKITTTHEEI